MSDWLEATVSQVATRVTKGTTPPSTDFAAAGVRYIKVESIGNDGTIDRGRLAFVNEDAHLQVLKRSILQRDDVLFTIAGTIGRASIVEASLLPANTNQAVAIVRPNPELVRPRFLYYALRDRERVRSAVSRTVQSVQSNLSLAELGALPLSLPPLPEQQAIAEVLGALDEKIAANTALAATAEHLLRDEIDEVWLRSDDRSSVLSDFVELNPKMAVPRTETAIYVDMKRLPESGWSIDGFDYREPKGGARFQNGDTLLARITPCLENRKTGFVDHLGRDEVGIGSTEFIVVRSRDGIAAPISFLLTTAPRFREHAIQHMIGTSGRQRVAASDLAAFAMPAPDSKWLAEFGSRAEALFEVVANQSAENRTLAATRDALLPQLMSGKLRVRDAERVVSEAGA